MKREIRRTTLTEIREMQDRGELRGGESAPTEGRLLPEDFWEKAQVVAPSGRRKGYFASGPFAAPDFMADRAEQAELFGLATAAE